MDAHNDSVTSAVPLLDIKRENNSVRNEIRAALNEVVESGQFILGPAVQQLEESVSTLTGADHAIGCASGSDALLLALLAHEIGDGDEVIVPSFTFFATASAVSRLGARPVFADIDPVTFNMDPQHVASLVTSKTKAVIAVHLFGLCAEMDALRAITEQHNVVLIEDAAQSIGARYHGRPSGAIGDVACFSFYPTKNLGGAGDGGMLTTCNADLADRLRLLRVHGMRPRYFHKEVGINSRLDSLQAAVLNVKLRKLSEWTNLRAQNAARYNKLFCDSDLSDALVFPSCPSNHDHVWNQYTIRVRQGLRDALRANLAEANIGTEIYYPVPVHQQECYRYLNESPVCLVETERAAQEVLSLPIFPLLTVREQESVVTRIAHFFRPANSAPVLGGSGVAEVTVPAQSSAR